MNTEEKGRIYLYRRRNGVEDFCSQLWKRDSIGVAQIRRRWRNACGQCLEKPGVVDGACDRLRSMSDRSWDARRSTYQANRGAGESDEEECTRP